MQLYSSAMEATFAPVPHPTSTIVSEREGGSTRRMSARMILRRPTNHQCDSSNSPCNSRRSDCMLRRAQRGENANPVRSAQQQSDQRDERPVLMAKQDGV